MIAIPTAGRACRVELRVEREQDDSFSVYADGVLVAAHENRYQAGAHCLRLYAQQEAEQGDECSSN